MPEQKRLKASGPRRRAKVTHTFGVGLETGRPSILKRGTKLMPAPLGGHRFSFAPVRRHSAVKEIPP